MPNYAAHFPPPPIHGVSLKPPYIVSTPDELVAERGEIRRHVSLARRGAGGQDTRLAEKYGHPTLKEKHPDDNDEELEVENAKWAATKDGFKPEHIQKVLSLFPELAYALDLHIQILQNTCTVLTIRDIVLGIPDWKLLDPEHHPFARRALPVTEEDPKNQEWAGKTKKEDGDAKSTANGAPDVEPKGTGNGQSKVNGQANGNGRAGTNGAGNADGTHEDESSDDDDDMDEDMKVLASFRNASGKPNGPLQPLGVDAWKQLEMRVQVEDQPDPAQAHALTGKHPMNAEADMSALFAAGMITPTKLHCVRNHGAVPCLDWDTHMLSVFADEGLLTEAVFDEIPYLRDFKPRKFTMDDLGGKDAMFAAIELPRQQPPRRGERRQTQRWLFVGSVGRQRELVARRAQLQSVVCVLAHGERIAVPRDAKAMYTVRGFAYHGAGLAVQRVEISLDGGQTWKGCFRQFVDEPLHHGTKHWAWIFWSCDVQYSELLNGKEIVVRAWDACKNVQPERISWNILGMMNNSWYHVKLAFEGKPLALTAKHPVAPGAKAGGWMVPPAEDKGSGCKASDDKTFTLDEVAKHASDDDCWIILDETVYVHSRRDTRASQRAQPTLACTLRS
ncbi:hypothetical protein AURDEDRAFT_177759 [Auricularia subglabra TFB-10046 SS5]|uniref:Moybdenum cofactor oxidoreductase dimerisation domain-containing protein n=1 Tax=Auricularia subglabra (strain TFB-10046 / SS5) TaxID=717982 RepID=J0WLG5_AURST|nr:hypothetical protein AURDEDRAFT_177759 [Auricularia subglabra TFB-10046 SS5]